ncbi:uncharacterized protein LOC116292057 [Actinia tenebrosa]|uniref:Uncharacterized protein LOC116292057 n=1 Tax=Actinia tenebrosa TaxID=6105 RepID=A0A6P8HRA1_ACTTE|nr:uncharacterized protein LOC116292057 [Actinia tenebrosa]
MLFCHLGRILRRTQWNCTLKVSRTTISRSSAKFSNSDAGFCEALDCIKTKLEPLKKTQIFLGTGQYYAHEANERIVVLSLGESGSLDAPLELLDTGIPSEDIHKLEKEIIKLPQCSLLASGEVDSVHEEPWNFGFIRKPNFSIFCKFGYNVIIKELNAGPAFRVFNGPLFEDVYLRNVMNLQIKLSEEPWHERKLELLVKNGEPLTVLEDLREEGLKDLGEVMTSTEWMVKAAGYMCLMARQIGNSPRVSLRLPEELRADMNPWVDLRNKAWIDRINDDEEKAK